MASEKSLDDLLIELNETLKPRPLLVKIEVYPIVNEYSILVRGVETKTGRLIGKDITPESALNYIKERIPQNYMSTSVTEGKGGTKYINLVPKPQS